MHRHFWSCDLVLKPPFSLEGRIGRCLSTCFSVKKYITEALCSVIAIQQGDDDGMMNDDADLAKLAPLVLSFIKRFKK